MFMRTVAYTPKGVGFLKIQDYGLALYARVPGLGNAEFIGAFGSWWPLPNNWKSWLPKCSAGCGNGFCIGFETCHCLPSYTGRDCTTMIPQFKSVGTRLPGSTLAKTREWLKAAEKNKSLPEGILGTAREAFDGFVKFANGVSVLEVLMFFMLIMYLLGGIFGSPSRLVRSRFATFTSSSIRDFNPLGVLLANFMHSSLLDLFLNLTFFSYFAPAAYARLGERKFLYLVGCCCLSAQATSLLWRKLSGSNRRATVGASGWIIGLESYVLAAQAVAVQWTGAGSMFVLKESVVRHLLLDFIVGGWRTDWAAALGGFVGGVCFLRYVEPALGGAY